MRLTFKKNQPTGRWRSFDSAIHDIKADGQKVGQISRSRMDPNWKVSFAFKREPTKDSPCPLVWRIMKVQHLTDDDARAWVTRNWDGIHAKFDLHRFE
jgi:hypothetical protein